MGDEEGFELNIEKWEKLCHKVQEEQNVIPFKEIESAIRQSVVIRITEVCDYEVFSKIVEGIVTPGLVKDFCEREERDYDATDFQAVPTSAAKSLKCLKLLFEKLKFTPLDSKLAVNFLMPVLILCGTHCYGFLWSNEETTFLSAEIIKTVVEITDCSTLSELLCRNIKGHPYTLFKNILLFMRPSLTKGTWTRNPSNCQVFRWLLFHVQHPHLVDFLPDVLPPSLMFIDHHTVQYKSLGIQCLHHVIENVPPSELKLYGRADVVYDALFHLIYCREPDIIHLLYPCLLKFLSGQERNLHNSRQPRQWGRFDDVYYQLMWNMEMEDKFVLRREFSAHVSDFIRVMGVTVVKHLQRTKRVLLNYMSISDGPEEVSRINAMNSLCMLIKVAWPRIENHCEDFLKSILYLVYDIETNRTTSIPEVKESLLSSCRECIRLFRAACPEKFQELSTSIKEVDESIPAVEFFFTCEKSISDIMKN